MSPAMWLIFALTYVGIALGRIPGLVLDRSAIAVLGAVAMLAIGGITIDQAAAAVNKPTMLLLFGLMLFAGQLRLAGLPIVVDRFLERFVDSPKLLLAMIIGISAIVSALLANDIVCLAFTPLVCRSLLQSRRDPLPYLLALGMSSNIGSALTIIGNPQNMYIGSVAHLAFGRFALVMSVPVLAGLGICWAMIAWMCRREMAVVRPPPMALPDDMAADVDTFLIVKTLVLVAALVGFFFYAGQDSNLRAIGAVTGAGLLLVSTRKKAAGLQKLADWNLLLLFIGLFIVNGAMQDRHLITGAFNHIAAMGLHAEHPATLVAVTAVLSNLVSNVPTVLLLEPRVAAAAGHVPKLWYLLSMSATLAGNMTLIGSIANLIVAESAAKYGVTIDLKSYCRIGVPVALMTVILGAAWLILM